MEALNCNMVAGAAGWEAFCTKWLHTLSLCLVVCLVVNWCSVFRLQFCHTCASNFVIFVWSEIVQQGQAGCARAVSSCGL